MVMGLALEKQVPAMEPYINSDVIDGADLTVYRAASVAWSFIKDGLYPNDDLKEMRKRWCKRVDMRCWYETEPKQAWYAME